MSRPVPIRVVGVGSPHGDDAVAWRVTQAVQQQRVWGRDIEFHVVEGGQRLLDVLDGKGTLLLIDALAPAGSPGAIHRFAWPDQRIVVLRPGSTHDMRPAEAIYLAEALGTLPQRVLVFAIEGECFEPHRDLSPAVAAAVPQLTRALVEELAAR
jgi:hydrogenase maturation protease